jgi:hypothetical protein
LQAAADEHNVSVFVGLGNYAWFTFDAEALCWTKRVASEVWSRYGGHRSVYGWYVAGEMAGDFSSGGPNKTATVEEMAAFFDGFAQFSATTLTPVLRNDGSTMAPSLLPVMFAINTGDVLEFATAPVGGWVGGLCPAFVFSFSRCLVLGFRTWDIGYGIWGMGFGIWDLGFGIWDLGFGIWHLTFEIWGGEGVVMPPAAPIFSVGTNAFKMPNGVDGAGVVCVCDDGEMAI